MTKIFGQDDLKKKNLDIMLIKNKYMYYSYEMNQ